MKILVTSDLHYDITRSREPTRDLARRVCAKGGDALVLVGDTAGARLEPLGEALTLFDGFPGKANIGVAAAHGKRAPEVAATRSFSGKTLNRLTFFSVRV